MARETSIEAYRYLVESGKLSERRLQVYQILFKYGPMSGGMVVEKARAVLPISNSGTLNTRLSELREMGLAKEVGTKECEVTGRKVIYWDVTSEKEPKPLKRKNKTKEKIDSFEKTLDQLRSIFLRMNMATNEGQIGIWSVEASWVYKLSKEGIDIINEVLNED